MNSSKSWADVEDEFPPSPPRKPEPSPPAVRPIAQQDEPIVTRIEAKQRPTVAPASEAGPKPVPYLKMNRFTESSAAPAAQPPKVKPTNSDRRLWEPAAGGSDRFQRPLQQQQHRTGGSNRSLLSSSGGNKSPKFEVQMKNVPAEVTEDEVRTMLAGVPGVNKVRRNAKNQLVFVELASKQALEQALAKKYPQTWEVKQVIPMGKQQQQQPVEQRKATKPSAPPASAPAVAKPKKEKKKEEKKAVVATNAFGALYEESESSSSEGEDDDQAQDEE